MPAAEADQRGGVAEAERHANVSVATRPSQPKPITAPTPAQQHTSREAPATSSEKLARLNDVESASACRAAASRVFEDAKHLYRAGMASDPVFAAHVVAGAVNECNRATGPDHKRTCTPSKIRGVVNFMGVDRNKATAPELQF
jgi:hypothetical protein